MQGAEIILIPHTCEYDRAGFSREVSVHRADEGGNPVRIVRAVVDNGGILRKPFKARGIFRMLDAEADMLVGKPHRACAFDGRAGVFDLMRSAEAANHIAKLTI